MNYYTQVYYIIFFYAIKFLLYEKYGMLDMLYSVIWEKKL